MKVLLLDNQDSFTWNIYHYTKVAGLECITLRSDRTDLNEIKSICPDAFIISPGPGRPKDHPLIFRVLEKYTGRNPIFGICLGFQAIGEFFGAELKVSNHPVHGKTAAITHNNHIMYNHIPQSLVVGRYHSLILDSLNGILFETTATTQHGTIMSFSHNTLPVWGVQYHPESVLTPFGQQIFNNWSSEVQKTLSKSDF